MAKLTPKTPWHLWLVGLLGLAWNAFGAWDYLQTKLENREYLEMSAEPMGVSVDAVIAYFDAYPLWADIAWGLGVWGSVAGSILLLMKSRHAALAFLVSIGGFIVGMVQQVINPMEGVTDNTMLYVMSAVIFALLVGQWLYARAMTTKGVLK